MPDERPVSGVLLDHAAGDGRHQDRYLPAPVEMNPVGPRRTARLRLLTVRPLLSDPDVGVGRPPLAKLLALARGSSEQAACWSAWCPA